MPQRDPAKERHWRRMLRQWRQSGLTPRQFCNQQHLSEPNFYAWRRELARRDRQAPPPAAAAARRAPSPAFLPVALAMDATPAATIEVVLGDRRVLRVRPGCDVDLLRQLVHLLEERPC